MTANSGLTFGALSRRQQCEAATLIVSGVVSSALAIAMFVGSMMPEHGVRAAADVVLAGETPAAVSESRVAAVEPPGAANAADRSSAIAVSAPAPRRAQSRRVTASIARPAALQTPRAEPGRSRFARVLFGDGRRHVVRPFPVIDTSSPETR